MMENHSPSALVRRPRAELDPAARLVARGLSDLRSARVATDRERWIAAGHALPREDIAGRLACFRRAVDIDPASIEAWRLLGQTLGEAGHWEEALQTTDKTQQLIATAEPFDAYGCWLDRANVLIALSRFDEGLACCEAASVLWPDGCAAYDMKGLALHDLGRFEEAIACFDAFLERTRYAYDEAYGWNYKASSLRRLGRSREALAACERAIEQSPSEPAFWVTKGNCLRDLRMLDDALRSHSHALSLQPSDWGAWFNKALVLEDLGRWDQAVQSFEHYLSVVPAGEPGIEAARGRLDSARKRAALERNS